ncbi:hypothetical protein HanPI659440_Chr11g0414201 [Helianthus annuus]|nr:hypothetical protein HanPI659440_Chr11g0414201 [Helianthus annuus]
MHEHDLPVLSTFLRVSWRWDVCVLFTQLPLGLSWMAEADARGVSLVVEGVVNKEIGAVLGGEAPNVEGQNVEAVPGDGTHSLEGASPKGSEGSQNSPQVEDISSGNEYLETRLSRKCKPDLVVGTSEVIPKVQNICSRLRNASNKKSQPASQTMSEALPVATKVSLSKHLKVLWPISSLVLGPLPGSLKAPIAIPSTSAPLKIKQKDSEVNVALTKAVHVSPTHASSQSIFQLPSSFRVRTPLAPLFAEGYPPPYVPNWKITSSSALKEENKDLEDRLKTSQTIAAKLQCRVVSAERGLLDKEAKLMREREQLVEDVNHYKAAASVCGSDVETLYAELGIVQDDNQKLAAEHHWLLSKGFGCFLAAFTQSLDFTGSLERTYQVYQNVGYQAWLKDGYAFSSHGMRRKETPTTNLRPRSSYPSCMRSSPVKPLLFLLNCLITLSCLSNNWSLCLLLLIPLPVIPLLEILLLDKHS